MKKIGELLGELLGKEGMGELNDLVRIRNGWSGIVGEEKGRRSRPYKLQEGRLYVGTQSHSWAQELHYDVAEIKRRVRDDLGVDIREIIIKKISLK